MSKPRLEFWYEFGSTYTYLSVMRIEALAEAVGVSLAWKPFLLMPVLNHLGVDNPFITNAAKCAYMWADLMRRAEALDIPIKRPSVYPPNALVTARVARLGIDEGWGVAFTKEAFRQHWLNDVIIGTEANTQAGLAAAGQDPEAALARALSDANKAALRAQTEAAIALGLFGAPSFVVDGELFWGDDRLEEALARAAGRR
jgi:2-hydroxychromene-2-carboxylate isomerase